MFTFPISLIISCFVDHITEAGERSFSTLKLLKTYLRSTMSENRLNGLAIMYMSELQLFDTIGAKN